MPTTTEDARKGIAANVRAVLGRNRTTQTQLAKILGMSQAAVSRRLSGELPFDTDELITLAQYFDVRMATLFEGVAGTSDQGNRSSIWNTAAYRAVGTGPKAYDVPLTLAA